MRGLLCRCFEGGRWCGHSRLGGRSRRCGHGGRFGSRGLRLRLGLGLLGLGWCGLRLDWGRLGPGRCGLWLRLGVAPRSWRSAPEAPPVPLVSWVSAVVALGSAAATSDVTVGSAAAALLELLRCRLLRCSPQRRLWPRAAAGLVVVAIRIDAGGISRGLRGQRVATPGDLLAIGPFDLHRDTVGPHNAARDAVVRAADPAADFERLAGSRCWLVALFFWRLMVCLPGRVTSLAGPRTDA